MNQHQLRELIAAVKAGRVSRRTFVRQIVGLGLAVPLANQLLANAGLAQVAGSSDYKPNKPALQVIDPAMKGEPPMALYELRTYTLYVGKMAEVVKLYQEIGFPALQKGGQDKKLVGYFQSDTGMINQLLHLWKFDDDADRRAHWAGLSANKDFVEGFVQKFRPLVMTQEVKLLQAAPWGPHP